MGKITRLQLENFTCFAKLDVEFSGGVNILIGENGTGKTHILKVLYAACAITVGEGKGKHYDDKLRDVFSPYGGDNLRLYRHPLTRHDVSPIEFFEGNHELLHDALRVVIKTDMAILKFWAIPGMEEKTSTASFDHLGWTGRCLESIYIPVKEMLAHAPGFISLTAKREISFEEIYVDIIKRAYLPKLKTFPNQAYEKIHETLGKAIGGTVTLKGEHFFLKTQKGEIEFSLLAEGLRKIALLWLLIQNGSLNPGTLLFWDEPEANLNPSLIGLVAETVLELQRQGVQIFLTTHNYVLLKEFDLRKRQADAVRYISLYRDESDAVTAQTTDDYLAIQPNAIAGTFDDLYDREIKRSLTGV